MSNLRIALLDTSARRLFAAHAQSCVGSGMAFVGLPLLAYEFTGSAWAVAAVLLPEIAPAIVLGPLLGALIDRFGWRRTMIAADVLRALAFLALWQAGSLTMAIIGAFVAGLGTAAFNPAALTALGALTPDGERRAASMGLFGALDDAGLTLGPALAGALLAIVEPAALMAVNAATFGLSAMLLMTLRGHDQTPVEAAQEPSLLAAAVTGWREIASRPRVKLLLASSTAAVACVGINNVGEVILAREVLGGRRPGAGRAAGGQRHRPDRRLAGRARRGRLALAARLPAGPRVHGGRIARLRHRRRVPRAAARVRDRRLRQRPRAGARSAAARECRSDGDPRAIVRLPEGLHVAGVRRLVRRGGRADRRARRPGHVPDRRARTGRRDGRDGVPASTSLADARLAGRHPGDGATR
jgi:hypothetical protein